MMANYPYYRYPSYIGYQAQFSNNQYNVSHKKENVKNEHSDNKKEDTKNNPIFELFGIQLYFDDVLLIFLILFLFNQGTCDDYLIIALILLLLT